MNIRKDIRNYTSGELNKLRIAMKAFQEKAGVSSYIDIAGYHGIPRALCPHGSTLFLPWHRYYIFKFESELKKIDSSVNLPYWDWTSMESLQTGIPVGYEDPSYNLPSGALEENSLFNGPIEDRSRKTKRFPGRVEQLKSISDSARLAYKKETYELFNSAIEGPHGSIHVWVGGGGANRGEMSSVPRAAFDPIFWAHHTNIDRQWAVWQSLFPQDIVPNNILNSDLPGFAGKKVKDVINYMNEELGYTYEDLQLVNFTKDTQNNIKLLSLDLKGERTVLKAEGIVRSKKSYLVDIFIVNKTNNSETFGGSFGIFGADGIHDSPHSGHGHHHEIKTDQYIDISDALRMANLSTAEIEIKLTSLDQNGNIIYKDDLPIDNLEIITL